MVVSRPDQGHIKDSERERHSGILMPYGPGKVIFKILRVDHTKERLGWLQQVEEFLDPAI
jgi:hypothetical protein